MTRLRLRYLPPLCDVVNKTEETVVAVDGISVQGLAEYCSLLYGWRFRELFFDSEGRFTPQVLITVNGLVAEDYDWKLADGDELTFVPPVAGG